MLKSDGTIWGTGQNRDQQLGIRDPAHLTNWTKVATGAITINAGDSHSFYIKKDKSLWATGRNDYHQLGYASPSFLSKFRSLSLESLQFWKTSPDTWVPVLGKTTLVSGGFRHSFAQKVINS